MNVGVMKDYKLRDLHAKLVLLGGLFFFFFNKHSSTEYNGKVSSRQGELTRKEDTGELTKEEHTRDQQEGRQEAHPLPNRIVGISGRGRIWRANFGRRTQYRQSSLRC
jgi:hypothetical protein